MERLVRDVHYAVRRLLKKPAFTTIAAGALLAASVASFPRWLPAQAGDEEAGGPDSAAVANAPLFASTAPVHLTLIADFKQLRKDRDAESEYRPATIVIDGGDTLELRVRTRGNFRLDKNNCQFPPLRLNFKKKGVAGTVFEGQDKLKLVGHCNDGREEYEQYVLKEYSIYRIFNEMSPMSFRARLVEMTYIDTSGDKDPITKPGFIIEDKDHMAMRNGWQFVSAPVIPPEFVDPEQMKMVEVFHYLIGNLDWDPFLAEPDETECCHNQKPIGTAQGPIYTIPYDFDMAGLVNARYAKPPAGFRIRRVTDRRFNGLCRPEGEMDATLDMFVDQRDAIYAIYSDIPGMTTETREKVTEYLDKFYEVLDDPKKRENEFVKRCRQI